MSFATNNVPLHSVRYLQFIDPEHSIRVNWIMAPIIGCVTFDIKMHYNISPLITRMRWSSILDCVVCCSTHRTRWNSTRRNIYEISCQFPTCKCEIALLVNGTVSEYAYRDPSRSKHDDVIKWKLFPCYWPFVRGIHRSTVNSPHKGQWRGALIFSLMCVWINGWVNNREAGDLRCYSVHCDVIVMIFIVFASDVQQNS